MPDRAASGIITELEADCSLLPFSSLLFFPPHLLYLVASQWSEIIFHIQNVSPPGSSSLIEIPFTVRCCIFVLMRN